MSRQNLGWVIGLLMLIAAVAYLASEWKRQTEVSAATAQLESRWKVALEQAKKVEPTARAPISSPAKPALSITDKTSEASPAPRLNPLRGVATNSEYRSKYLNEFRNSVYAQFGDLFRTLGLTPEQVDRFTDVTVAAAEERLEIAAAESSLGLESGDSDVADLTTQSVDKYLQNIRSALGDDQKYDRFMQYRSAVHLRDEIVRPLTALVADTGEALSTNQYDRLTEVLLANSPGPREGLRTVAAVDWPAVSAAASQFLSPLQLEGLRYLQLRTSLATRVPKPAQTLSGAPPPRSSP